MGTLFSVLFFVQLWCSSTTSGILVNKGISPFQQTWRFQMEVDICSNRSAFSIVFNKWDIDKVSRFYKPRIGLLSKEILKLFPLHSRQSLQRPVIVADAPLQKLVPYTQYLTHIRCIITLECSSTTASFFCKPHGAAVIKRADYITPCTHIYKNVVLARITLSNVC